MVPRAPIYPSLKFTTQTSAVSDTSLFQTAITIGSSPFILHTVISGLQINQSTSAVYSIIPSYRIHFFYHRYYVSFTCTCSHIFSIRNATLCSKITTTLNINSLYASYAFPTKCLLYYQSQKQLCTICHKNLFNLGYLNF